jgi:hypothetical protein
MRQMFPLLKYPNYVVLMVLSNVAGAVSNTGHRSRLSVGRSLPVSFDEIIFGKMWLGRTP